MFGKAFKRRFALTDRGVANVKKGTFWTVIVNFVDFAGIGLLFVLTRQLMAMLLDGAPAPTLGYGIGAVVVFLIVSFAAHKMQYKNTYGTVYGEVSRLPATAASRPM